MKLRDGFTIVELLVAMTILSIAIALVVVNFRQVNEREYLRQAAVDMVTLLQDLQSKAIGNVQPSSIPAEHASDHAVRFIKLANATAQGIIEDVSPNDSFIQYPVGNSYVFPRNVVLERIADNQPSGSNLDALLVGFQFGNGKPRVARSQTQMSVPTFATVTLTFKNTQIQQCWRVQIFPNGLISQSTVACP